MVHGINSRQQCTGNVSSYDLMHGCPHVVPLTCFLSRLTAPANCLCHLTRCECLRLSIDDSGDDNTRADLIVRRRRFVFSCTVHLHACIWQGSMWGRPKRQAGSCLPCTPASSACAAAPGQVEQRLGQGQQANMPVVGILLNLMLRRALGSAPLWDCEYGPNRGKETHKT